MPNHVIESRPVQRLTPRFNIYIAIPIILFTVIAGYYIVQLIQYARVHVVQWIQALAPLFIGACIFCGIVLLLAKGLPKAWKAYQALEAHKHERADREMNRALLQSLAVSIQSGMNTEYSNTRTGDAFKVSNPYALSGPQSRVTNVQELASQKEQKLLAGPGLETEYPDPQDFAEVLKFWRPSDSEIYLIDTVNGPVTVPHNKTFHTALAGPTGAGKTNMFRLLLAQSLYCGADVVVANPNYAPIKMNGSSVEDWRPIAAMLKTPVARRIEDIMQVIDDGIAELDDRRERQQRDPRPFVEKHYAFGEWPAIVSMLLSIFGKKVADAYTMKYGRLLRESRQYNYHVISEFQDALIQTIGGNSGVRENYRTAIYAGGDPITAKALLDLRSGEPLPDEAGLGQMGGVLVRCETNRLARGRVPFLSNRALYMLCGTPDIALPDKTDQLTPDMLTRIRESYIPDVYSAKTQRMEDLPMRSTVSTYRIAETPGNTWETGAGTPVETPSEANSNIIDGVFGNSRDRNSSLSTEGSIPTVETAILETIRRMKSANESDRKIAKYVGLSGRKYGTYQQVCRELGFVAEKAEGE